jgi:hypothetical protein
MTPAGCCDGWMRLLATSFAVALLFLFPEGGGASSSTILHVSPKHGGPYSTYVVSFKAEFPVSKAAGSQYVIGAVNSGTCTRGISSFGRISTGPYKVGDTVRFRVRFPKKGFCVGVFHGVAHWEQKEGDHFRDVRVGRFGFRVLSLTG